MQDTMKLNLSLTSAAARGDSMAYPFYSIRTDKPALLSEMRGLLASMSIEHTEQLVPGTLCNEIGFFIEVEDLGRIFESRAVEDDLRVDFIGWLATPPLAKLPDGLAVPDSCLPAATTLLEATASSALFQGRGTMCVLNNETDEVASVDFDYDNDSYVVDRDVSGWKYPIILAPELFAAAG